MLVKATLTTPETEGVKVISCREVGLSYPLGELEDITMIGATVSHHDLGRWSCSPRNPVVVVLLCRITTTGYFSIYFSLSTAPLR